MENSLIREVTAKYIGARKKSERIGEARDAVPFIRKLLKDTDKEHFIALYLNGANEVRTFSIVTIGLLNSTQVHPREVFRPAILVGAASIIVAHNHPSGQVKPSDADIRVTSELISAGKLLGIKVLDHIIFTDREFLSLQEKGALHFS